MVDVFQEVRERVSALDVAQLYGFHPNRAGFIPCPFHHERTASLKLYPGAKGFYCFGCHTGGSVIDLVAQLYGLDALGAVRRLNDGFHLGLPIDRQQTPQERTEAARAAAKRREVSDAYRLFEQWRDDLTRQLNGCFRLAHETMRDISSPADLDKLTDSQALAIREQAYIEWLSDTLSGGSMLEQMEIFRGRGQIGQLCKKILNHSPMKSGAA